MRKPRYIVEYDPLSWTGHGSYIVKENNTVKTPYCVVLIGIGIDKELAKKYAEVKAKNIASALEFQENVTEHLNKVK